MAFKPYTHSCRSDTMKQFEYKTLKLGAATSNSIRKLNRVGRG